MRLEPAEAARICGPAARTLTDALELQKDANDLMWLVESLESVASRLEPAEAGRICGQAARMLIPYMERIRSTASPYETPSTRSVCFVSSRMDPSEAASMLAIAIEHAENADVRHSLVLSLVSVAGRLDAAEDARICRQAARVLIAALGPATESSACMLLAEEVVSVVGRFDKTEAAQICRQAAQVLVVAFAREKDANARNLLASALATLSARLDSAEAARICARPQARFPTPWSGR